MDNFNNAHKFVEKWEGGYVNNPNDRGGETNFGITKKTAMQFGYDGDMKFLTKQQAKDIYKQGYWNKPNFNKIRNDNLAACLFGFGVNIGLKRIVKFLQTILNDYKGESMLVDGMLGSKTLTVINASNIDCNMLCFLLCCNVSNYYMNLAIKRPSQRVFLKGWQRRALDTCKRFT